MYTEPPNLYLCGDHLKLHKIQETSFLWAFGHNHTKSGLNGEKTKCRNVKLRYILFMLGA